MGISIVKMNARVLRSGPLSSVQDLGRFGHRAIGVGTSGALDPFAARVANLLVGNDESAALIEIALGNFRIRFHDERLIAWCGGSFEVHDAKEEIPAGHVFFVRAGDEITIAKPKRGCRAWLAVSGGIDVPLVLASRSTDLRAEFGGLDGRSLRDGDDLPLGENPIGSLIRFEVLRHTHCSDWSAPREWTNPSMHYPSLRVLRGADWKRFDSTAHEELYVEVFSVTADADRMGVRLDGPDLKRSEASDLLSEAVAPGTLQVPPNGKPILLLGDCQTIGGYPKIAHMITVDQPIAAQLRPGDEVRFSETSISEAHAMLVRREHDLARFRIGLSLKT
jgi:antagonist of KipI